MALNPCVKRILCALGAGVLQGLKAVVAPLQAQIDAQILVLEAELTKLDILLIPVTAAQQIVDQLTTAARQSLALLPLSILAECADLGQLNLNIVAGSERLTANVNAFLDDASRLLSARDELAALIQELQVVRAFYNDLSNVLSECADGAT